MEEVTGIKRKRDEPQGPKKKQKRKEKGSYTCENCNEVFEDEDDVMIFRCYKCGTVDCCHFCSEDNFIKCPWCYEEVCNNCTMDCDKCCLNEKDDYIYCETCIDEHGCD